MADVFISYAASDGSAASLELERGLVRAGYTVYRFESDAPLADSHHTLTEEQLDGCRAVVLLLSPGIGDSPFVMEELFFARKRRKPILPLLLHLSYRCYEQFLKGVPGLSLVLAGASPLEIPNGDCARIMPRAIAGLKKAGVHPHGVQPGGHPQEAAPLLELLGEAEDYPTAFGLAARLAVLDKPPALDHLVQVVETDACEARVAACAWLLAEWRIAEAAGAMRAAIESRRRAPGPLGCLLRSLRKVEGPLCSAYLADVLLAAKGYQQEGILSMLANHADEFRGDASVSEAVAKLACRSTTQATGHKASQLVSLLG